jgi:uncharacterized membrane protein YphA (DoxX/SURF4 family)
MIGLPAEFALIIGLLEVEGGLFLNLGLLTGIIALLFTIEMISAFIIVYTSKVVILPAGYELGLLSILIIFMAMCLRFFLICLRALCFQLELWKEVKWQNKILIIFISLI